MQVTTETKNTPLDYRMERLLKLGFKPCSNDIDEIDQLLDFCKKMYT